jgi:ketosteroid isomerase-like protein
MQERGDPMISHEKAKNYAYEWIDAWNSHDLERILAYYSDDFEMTTPLIVKLMNHPTGTLKGKETIKPFWEKALTLIPGLRFELLDVLSSVDSISIHYKAVFGKRGMEVLFFDSKGKIKKSIAHYNPI